MQKQILSQSSPVREIIVNNALLSIETELPKELCQIIVDQYGDRETEQGTVQKFNNEGTEHELIVKESGRKTAVHWIDQKKWVIPMISYYIENINNIYFQYDLSGVSGGTLQYGIYKEGGHYDWHCDETRNLYYVTQNKETIRKLSFSLQLSDPDDYEGGDLLMKIGDKERVQSRERGTLIVFDSRQLHKVTPVTSGVRHSLVGWFVGPPWR